MSETAKELFSIGDYHRSRDRIRDLGEVFTPEDYVKSMLKMLSKGRRGFWERDDLILFEPTCGHGNIVVPILEKRLFSLFRRGKNEGIRKPELYAVAVSIDSIWATDIDRNNINHCRERVLSEILDFVLQSIKTSSLEKYIDKNYDFFCHLLCAIDWHIHENEALSCLASKTSAEATASQTKLGKSWYSENGHRQLDFSQSWTQYFRECDSNDLVPLIYERSQRFLENVIEGSSESLSYFPFARLLLTEESSAFKKKSIKRSEEVGL